MREIIRGDRAISSNAAIVEVSVLMRSVHQHRRVLRHVSLSALGLLLAGLIVAGLAEASSATPRASITVSPSVNLHNHQKVSITGIHFANETPLVIVECNPGVLKGQSAACDSKHVRSATAGPTGTFPKTSFAVLTGTIGNGKCGTTAQNLTCYIFVSAPNARASGAPRTAEADAVITFVKPKS